MKPSSEREKTDESLRAEREKTDEALRERQAAAEADADQVVHLARENADAVLTAARREADERGGRPAPGPLTRADVAEERAVEDRILEDERAAADEALRVEREQNARAIAKLLPLERDTTDRHLLTERARSDGALLVRDDFLAIVSHDLRNLIGGILMSVGLLSAEASETEESRRTLVEADRIRRYAARMNRLVGDLVDVASIDAGKLAVTPSPGDAVALLEEAAEMFAAAASAKGVSLEIDTSERPLPVEFDNDRMLQVLANLVGNAIKFTAEGDSIRVRGERAGDGIRVTVEDTGPGIPSGMLEAIFERFWQVGENDRRGIGLGLYISKCIVEAHGGRMWAESELGEWSRLSFTLPG
jgi:signal transduction histidine kinase